MPFVIFFFFVEWICVRVLCSSVMVFLLKSRGACHGFVLI